MRPSPLAARRTSALGLGCLLLLAACERDALDPSPVADAGAPAAQASPPRQASARCQGAALSRYDRVVSSTETAVHVLGVHEAAAPDGRLPVHLDLGRRAVLVLSSFAPVRWALEIEPGTSLSEVVVTGPAGSFAEGTAAPIENIESYYCATEYGSGACDTAPLLQLIRERWGTSLASLYGCRVGEAFGVVDARAPVRWDAIGGPPGLHFSADLLTVDLPTESATDASTITATHPRSRGRYYFEVSALALPSGKAALGLATGVGEGDCWYRARGAPSCAAGVALPSFAAGDTIGVAVDLEQPGLYFAKNGRWQSGDPQREPGLPLPSWVRRSGVYPAAQLAPGDQLKARFDPGDFLHAPPLGYGQWRR
jgi:hypothetical protein